MIRLRAAGPQDFPGAYRVCLQTADSGGDGTALYSNPDLLGHVYVGAYLAAQPEFAFVLVDEIGVAGYLLGAANTREFENWQENQWWPPLRDQYPLTAGHSLDDELISLLHAPQLAPQEVADKFPAHLHIDLLPRAQGHGWGRVLIETLFDAFTDRSVSAVHLDVGADNHNAIAFYKHLGFSELERGADSIYMGKDLA